MNKYLPELPANKMRIFAISIANAIGDGIRQDVQSLGLVTQNGDPGRIWDILHTGLVKGFRNSAVVAQATKRGGWKILPVFDKDTGVIICCMREKNFKQVAGRNLQKQKRHYLYALTKAFNSDLPYMQQQLQFYPDNSDDEESTVNEAIARITLDMGIPASSIKRHALVLFHSYGEQLISLRCCAINSRFEIVESEELSELIPTTDSIIVDKVVDETNVRNTPDQGLNLSEKAKSRLGRKRLVSESREENTQNAAKDQRRKINE